MLRAHIALGESPCQTADCRRASSGSRLNSTRIVSASEPIQHLADGYGGAHGPAEGPLWWKEGGYLLFSDIHNNRRMKHDAGQERRRTVSRTDQPRQRPDPRPAGPARRLRARQPPRHPARTGRQPDRRLQQLSGAPAQPAERCRRQVRRLHLLHRPVDQPQRAEPVGSAVLRRLSPDPGSRHAVAAGRRFHAAQRPRLLARRERALHQRHAARPYPRLRRDAERHAGAGTPTACSPICAAPSPASPTA